MPVASISRKDAQTLLAFCKEHNQKEFFFAVDHGAYFGSNVGEHGKESFKNCIIFLKGCDPDKYEDWYDQAHYKFGGDDMGVHLPVQWLEAFCNHPSFNAKRTFSVNIGQRKASLVC
ncbi:MAG: hypothetical protein CML22_07020 [Rheinheimera sp.]|nr:hypothetical protein [Rheinheimera sp.]MBM34035.1 hypothetical protein [Rheinheimera sp.]|tara:strand:+ start:1812 stop:2162 length:351 start_codon:yes stop_codon:yes gene_type:complete